MQVTSIVVAAGKGERLGLGFNKVYADLAGKPVLVYSLATLQACESVEQIILVTGESECERAAELVEQYGLTKVKNIVVGGSARFRSVAAALPYISCRSQYVLVHDGARPLLSAADLAAVIEAAENYDGAILAKPVTDTIKQAATADSEMLRVDGTLDRSALWCAQTPQVFPVEMFLDAYANLDKNVTDDASLMEAMGADIRIVPGSPDNIKITNPIDLALAELLLAERRA